MEDEIKVVTVQTVKDLLVKSDKAVERGIVAIYKRQTEDEQSVKATMVHNGRGFTAFDATFLSSLAERIIDGNSLTEKQIFFWRKKIMKYAKQLLEVVKENNTGAYVVSDGKRKYKKRS